MTAESVAVRWSHVGLNSCDVDVTEDFYRTWFGFERARVVVSEDDILDGIAASVAREGAGTAVG